MIGRLPGRDPVLSRRRRSSTRAHHDHLGHEARRRPGEPARLQRRARQRVRRRRRCWRWPRPSRRCPSGPRRTILFAAVAAEEQGLLGSTYLADHPPVPAGRLAANVNIDGMNIWGRTQRRPGDRPRQVVARRLDPRRRRDAGTRGGPRSLPGPRAPSTARTTSASPALGVPAAYLDAGTEVIGQPPGWGRERRERVARPRTTTSPRTTSARLGLLGRGRGRAALFLLGAKVADAPRAPAWQPGDEFEAARLKALRPSSGGRPCERLWLEERGRSACATTSPCPIRPPGEALVRVRLAGVCNTDLEMVRGYYPYAGVPGHEFVGVVEEAAGAPEWVGPPRGGRDQRRLRRLRDLPGGPPHATARRRTRARHRGTGRRLRRRTCACRSRTCTRCRTAVPDEVAVFTEPMAAALELQEQVRRLGPTTAWW